MIKWLAKWFPSMRKLAPMKLDDMCSCWGTNCDKCRKSGEPSITAKDSKDKIAELESTLSSWREYALHLEDKLGMNNDDGEG